jgi:hypothetical protein
MMQRLQRLDSSSILSWFQQYNKVKDAANRANEEILPILDNEQVASSPVLQSQIGYYCSQKARLYYKTEVLDDVLNGMIEDLLENSSFEEAQKEEMRVALDATMARSRHRPDAQPAPA